MKTLMSLEVKDVIARADELYRQRADLTAIKQSVVLLQDFESYEFYWRLARSLFFLGQESESRAEASDYFTRGVSAAQAATEIEPGSVAGQFWLGVDLALLAQSEPGLVAVTRVQRAKTALGVALEIDESYHGAGAWRVLGRIQHKLPRLLGGSRRRARQSYERALTIAPENTVTRIFFAELLHENGDVQSARDQLESILALGLDGEWDFEISRDQLRAKQILELLE